MAPLIFWVVMVLAHKEDVYDTRDKHNTTSSLLREQKKHIHTPIHDHAFILTQEQRQCYVGTEVSMIRQTHEHNRVLVSVVSEIRDL